MFDQQPAKSRVRLFDGATVRLDIRWHNMPVFVADLCGNHYDVVGYIYDLTGQPVGEQTPRIVEVLQPH